MREGRLRVRWDSRYALFATVVGFLACGNGTTSSPFVRDAGTDAPVTDGAPEGGPPPPPNSEPTLGGPCTDTEQCDDMLECTVDTCDARIGRCRFTPDDRRCADDIYCDGAEKCVNGVGCTEGEPTSCSDSTTCTIDRCIEETRSCEHRGRDGDGDGDSVWNCEGGTDCDDSDARISGTAAETCQNGLDDDCDGEIDERDCTTPLFDTCLDPLVMDGDGSYAVSLASAAQDFSLSCATNAATRRDVVLALVVPDGPLMDIDISAVAETSAIALAVFGECSDPTSERACAAGVPRISESGSVARTILRGALPGTYPVIVSGVTDDTVAVQVSYDRALPEPENDTCGTASVLVPGEPVEVTLAAAARDLTSDCGTANGEVVFRFELEEPQDVELSVAPLDDRGEPIVSLRDAACSEPDSELTCRSGGPAVLFARDLPAGTYHAAVGSTGPSDVSVRLELFPPSSAPPGEGCQDPPELTLGRTEDVDLAHRADAIRSECSAGAADATFALTLDERSDVLLVERISSEDDGAVSLLGLDCEGTSSLACGTGLEGPVRARAYGVAKGEYRVVAESKLGSPVTLTAFARPARPTILVALSDHCEDAAEIGEEGGRFVGNTSNARADVEASCDFGGTPAGGAPDQLLSLKLSRPRRVVLDMQESAYTTLLVVREAESCPGPEVANTCVPGFATALSFLDTTLPAGDYFVQIDGYNQDSGAWALDVFTAEP